jgi:hypothetical protein
LDESETDLGEEGEEEEAMAVRERYSLFQQIDGLARDGTLSEGTWTLRDVREI